MTFDADGNLYATGWSSNTVTRYDGDTGAFIDTFVTTSLDQATDLQFGPDGSLYVASRGGLNAGVDKYDGSTGAVPGQRAVCNQYLRHGVWPGRQPVR